MGLETLFIHKLIDRALNYKVFTVGDCNTRVKVCFVAVQMWFRFEMFVSIGFEQL